MEEKKLSRDTCYKLITYFGDNATPQNRKFYNYFATTYNEIIEGGKTAVEAMASLSQIKSDVADERDKIFDSMDSIATELKALVNGIGSDNQELSYYKTVISQMVMYLLTGGTDVYDSNKFIVNQQKLKEIVDSLRDKVEEPSNVDYDRAVDNFFNYKSELILVNAQYVGLTDTVKNIIQQEYPKRIDTYSTDEEYLKEQQEKNRNYERDVPQKPIDVWVLKLIKKALDEEEGYKRYWHFEGRFEGTPNKNQIKKRLIKEKVVGELDDRTIIRRIKETIESYDISNLT